MFWYFQTHANEKSNMIWIPSPSQSLRYLKLWQVVGALSLHSHQLPSVALLSRAVSYASFGLCLVSHCHSLRLLLPFGFHSVAVTCLLHRHIRPSPAASVSPGFQQGARVAVDVYISLTSEISFIFRFKYTNSNHSIMRNYPTPRFS